MTKRLFTVLLALCLLAGLLPTAALAAKEDLSAYVPVLENAMKTAADPETFGEAMFFDLDDKAPRELILVYCPEDAAHAVVEVYAISGAKAERLLHEPLFVLAGGNTGSVSVGEYENKPILVTESASPEVLEKTVVVDGAVKRFGMQNGRLVLQESAVYREVIDITPNAPEDPVRYDESSSVIEGKDRTYGDYLDWRHSFVLLAANDGFTDADWNDDAEPFASALDYCATGFRDVHSDAWYAESVRWAAAKGVTEGTAEDRFSPSNTCTRAQFVTFLWRASGMPKVEDLNPFRDLERGSYYYDAVLWAASEGVTNGVAPGVFQPGGTLTRAQVVTFLWRLARSPYPGRPSGFDDVREGAWYADAVAWAVQAGVTNGMTKTTFVPSDPCTRAQTVTFLYRQLGGK